MKITIVTVCRNAESTINKTIESVLEQEYSDIEYIVIDGNSIDMTVNRIKEHLVDNTFVFISEPDKGIYDAMNKGVSMASGEYILFMNAGDVFADKRVIGEVVSFLDTDIIYGDVIREKGRKNYMERYKGPFKEMRLFLSGKMMCHQSMFVRTELLREHPFDLEYKITADYNFAVKMYALGKKYKHIDRVVCTFDAVDGISSQKKNNDLMRKEDDLTLKTYYPVLFSLIRIPKGVIRFVRRIIENRCI